MLRALHIENLAVIKRLDLDLENGFSVLTGETGAGKSIIIDSINLLLGNRIPRDLIRTGEQAATVCACFDELPSEVCQKLAELGFPCEDASLMLWRSLGTDGKSRVKLNGQTITQSLQREIAQMLVSIHGQSDSQKLLQKSAHLGLVDAYAHPDAERAAYDAAYGAWKSVCQRLQALNRDEAEVLRLSEMLKFQIADIDAMKLRCGEEEALIKERDRLLHMEHINKQSALIVRTLRGGERSGALDLIGRAESALRSLEGLADGSEELLERLLAAASEIEDIAALAEGYLDDDSEDPTARIDRMEERLDGIAKLKRKYGDSIEQILAFREKASSELDALVCSDEEKERLEAEEKRLRLIAQNAAQELHTVRAHATKEITAQVSEALSFLDMPRVQFEIRLQKTELTASGMDDAEFLIATNVGEPLQPMLKIASGGELSRIMLALRSVINDRDGASTVIFDEIDTGISGKTSRKVGMKLWQSAKHAQVICVTHSAQIASLADQHYRIVKTEEDGRANTQVEHLDLHARIEEIARILGGIEVTDVQRDAARQMIEEYRH